MRSTIIDKRIALRHALEDQGFSEVFAECVVASATLADIDGIMTSLTDSLACASAEGAD